MKVALDFPVHACQATILRLASRVVPSATRADWLEEWRAELWHVRHSLLANTATRWNAEHQITRFCLGAFSDAACLRQIAWQNRERRRSLHGSAAHCLLILVAILLASYWLSQQLAGVRAERNPARYGMNPGLMLIQNRLSEDDSWATIPKQQYRLWKASPQRYFDGFAFYRLALDPVSPGATSHENWSVAHASLNLFWMLGMPVLGAASSDAESGETPGLILSHEKWQREFGANPHIAGSFVRIGSREVKILGIAPEGAWRLPGAVDAWLLEPDTQREGLGYVIAHLTRLAQDEVHGSRVQITNYDSDDPDDSDLWGISLHGRTQGPWQLYEFTIFLAFLALPAVTSVALSEYNFSSHRPSFASVARRWAFLWAKIALLLPISYYLSIDLAYGRTTTYSVSAEYVQLIASFTICLFGLRWALLDQRHRCPVCLRRVTHPARVGYAGRTFLAWNGTEMICTGGHTLLHVPALPTSWFSTQRWLYLDSSWSFLFAGSGTMQ